MPRNRQPGSHCAEGPVAWVLKHLGFVLHPLGVTFTKRGACLPLCNLMAFPEPFLPLVLFARHSLFLSLYLKILPELGTYSPRDLNSHELSGSWPVPRLSQLVDASQENCSTAFLSLPSGKGNCLVSSSPRISLLAIIPPGPFLCALLL